MIGKVIEHYRVLKKLGSGGMGVVYQAEDTELSRPVALKFLSDDCARSSGARSRFRREAVLAAALNHPNVCTIYEVGEHEGQPFIVMEFLEGETLQQRVGGQPLTVELILDWGIQIANGLAAAHAQGMGHRDIKPGNIFITTQGQAKILDFGLAMTVEDDALTGGATLSALTQPGAVMGTVTYMSPEQVRGEKLDARTDVFSFGSVLYAMSTGRPAFPGATPGVIQEAILNRQPVPASQVNPLLPARIDDIIAKALEKDRELRYQSAAEFGTDLRRLARDLGHLPAASLSGSQMMMLPLASKPKRPRWISAAITAAIFLAALGAAALVWIFKDRLFPPSSNPAPLRLTTDSGLSIQPAVSLDGKMLAYASDRAGESNLDIWVRQVGGGDPIRLTRDPADDTEPAFSPDSTQVAFHSDREGGGLYTVPALGGQEHRLADGGRRPRFSPDGKQIAYWTGEPLREIPAVPRSAAIYVLDTAGGTPRRLRSDFVIATRPLWTPDGSHILFWGSKEAGSVEGRSVPHRGWWVTAADGSGPAQEVTAATAEFNPEIFHTSEASGWRQDSVVFSWRQEDNSVNVFEAPFSFRNWQVTGAPRRLTFGTTQEETPSVAADGSLAFSSIARNLDIYAVPIDNGHAKVAGPLQRLTTDLADDGYGSLSNDGKMLAFYSRRSGQLEVWIKNLTSGKEQFLASGESPMISPDGSQVAYLQRNPDRGMIISVQGGTARPFSSRAFVTNAWSPDQSRLLVVDTDKPKEGIETVDLASGHVSKYMSDSSSSLYPRSFSPDGKWISFTKEWPAGQQLMVAPFHPSTPATASEWVAVTSSGTYDFQPHWSSDGKVLYFVSDRDGFGCIWAQLMDPATQRPAGKPFALLHLHDPARRMRQNARHLYVAGDKAVVTLEERVGSIWMLRFK